MGTPPRTVPLMFPFSVILSDQALSRLRARGPSSGDDVEQGVIGIVNVCLD